MRKVIIMLLVQAIGLNLIAQRALLPEHLYLDSILFIQERYVINERKHEFDFLPVGNRLYTVTVNSGTGYDYEVSVYDCRTFKRTAQFKLPNQYGDHKSNGFGGVLGVAVRGDMMAILSSVSWHVYRVGSEEPVLLGKQRIEVGDEDNKYEAISFLNDSLLALSRSYKRLRDDDYKPVEVKTWDFVHHIPVSTRNIEAELPELCFFSPNHRISFSGDKVYLADFDKYRIYEAKGGGMPRLLINKEVSPVRAVNQAELKKARQEARSSRNISPFLRLLMPYYTDSIVVMSDVHAFNDSMLLLRYSLPRMEDSPMVDVWVCNERGCRLTKTLCDPIDYQDKRDTMITRSFFHLWLAANRYKVFGNKLYVLRWGSPVYPIGMSKRGHYRAEQAYLSEQSPVPFIAVYEFKDSFFRD